jgi:hypothetical protein
MISDYLSGDGTRINGGRERVLVGAELCTGGAAVVGGLLLITRPDGSLLHAKLSALSGSPFSDWLAPTRRAASTSRSISRSGSRAPAPPNVYSPCPYQTTRGRP